MIYIQLGHDTPPTPPDSRSSRKQKSGSFRIATVVAFSDYPKAGPASGCRKARHHGLPRRTPALAWGPTRNAPRKGSGPLVLCAAHATHPPCVRERKQSSS